MVSGEGLQGRPEATLKRAVPHCTRGSGRQGSILPLGNGTVDLLAESHPIELVECALVENPTMRLLCGVLGLGPRMIDVLDREMSSLLVRLPRYSESRSASKPCLEFVLFPKSRFFWQNEAKFVFVSQYVVIRPAAPRII
jgi:hypothetical protein